MKRPTSQTKPGCCVEDYPVRSGTVLHIEQPIRVPLREAEWVPNNEFLLDMLNIHIATQVPRPLWYVHHMEQLFTMMNIIPLGPAPKWSAVNLGCVRPREEITKCPLINLPLNLRNHGGLTFAGVESPVLIPRKTLCACAAHCTSNTRWRASALSACGSCWPTRSTSTPLAP